jgi:excisionase family DNA binding protein
VLSISPIDQGDGSAGRPVLARKAANSRADYTGQREAPEVWLGHDAAALELSGAIEANDDLAAIDGSSTADNRRLVDQQGDHRVRGSSRDGGNAGCASSGTKTTRKKTGAGVGSTVVQQKPFIASAYPFHATEREEMATLRAVGRRERPEASLSLRNRGRYFTLEQVAQEYPVFTMRLLRRLIQQRRIPFSRVGRRIVIAESDIEAHIEGNRVEASAWPL